MKRKFWTITKTCIFCSNTFITSHSKQKYCSSKCWGQILKTQVIGSANPNWQENTTNIQTGRSRAEVLYTQKPCSKCGNPKGERHHIDRDPLNNTSENISFLCRKCHMKEDGRLERFLYYAKTKEKAMF